MGYLSVVVGADSIKEDDKANDCRDNEGVGVESKPAEVHADLLAEVLADLVQWLVFVPHPFSNQNGPQ